VPSTPVRGGDSLGPQDRSPMERFTIVFPLSYNLLAPARGVVAERCVAGMHGSSTAQARPGRSPQPRPRDCRCNVFAREKRGNCVGKTKRGKGTKTLVLTDRNGLPLTVNISSASPHDSKLIEPLLQRRLLRRRIRRLIYDQAADSDPLRIRLARQGIELICPHRCNRIKPPLQDGRSLRRYRQRYKVERSISWLQAFRRLVTRYEHYDYRFLGFLQLACSIILLRQF
jgi:transposase